MSQADSLSRQWLKRAQVFEKLKAQLPSVCPSKTDDTGEDQAIGMTDEKAGMKDDAGNADAHANSAAKMDVEEISDDEMEDATTSSNNKTPSPCTSDADTNADSAPEMEDDEISGDEMEEDATTSSNNKTLSPRTSESHTETKQSESASLPSWRPRTQMYHNNSHVVVATFAPGMNMEQFNIMIDGADLVVRAKKQPTRQDILACRHGLEPCFGSLDLKVPLPVDVVHTEGATATYEDGILRVKFIKKQIPQHRYHRPAPRQHYPQQMRYRQPVRRNFFSNPRGFWLTAG